MSIVRSMLDAAQQRLAGFDFDVVTDTPTPPVRKPQDAPREAAHDAQETVKSAEA